MTKKVPKIAWAKAKGPQVIRRACMYDCHEFLVQIGVDGYGGYFSGWMMVRAGVPGAAIICQHRDCKTKHESLELAVSAAVEMIGPEPKVWKLKPPPSNSHRAGRIVD